MKSPVDASAHVDGKRHQNGMKIDNSAVKVMMYDIYSKHNTLLLI